MAEQVSLDGDDASLLERLIEDHRAAVAATAELTTAAGGEPYECANSWYIERVVTPMLAADRRRRVQGHPAERRPDA